MAGLPTAMWFYNRQHTPVSTSDVHDRHRVVAMWDSQDGTFYLSRQSKMSPCLILSF